MADDEPESDGVEEPLRLEELVAVPDCVLVDGDEAELVDVAVGVADPEAAGDCVVVGDADGKHSGSAQEACSAAAFWGVSSRPLPRASASNPPRITWAASS